MHACVGSRPDEAVVAVHVVRLPLEHRAIVATTCCESVRVATRAPATGDFSKFDQLSVCEAGAAPGPARVRDIIVIKNISEEDALSQAMWSQRQLIERFKLSLQRFCSISAH